MKIFYIDPMSYNNLAVYDYNLLNNNKEFDISLFGNINFSYKSIKGVTFYPLFRYSNKKKVMKLLSYLISLVKLLILILKNKPDVVHIQWIRAPFVDIIFINLIKVFSKKTKILFTSHNVFPHNYSQWEKKQYIKYYKKVDCIITHSYNSKNELINKVGLREEKIHVIFHGLLNYEIDKKVLEKEKNRLKANYKLADKIIISSLGVQSKYKGTDKIVEYFSNRTDNNNYFLIIAGKNNDVDFTSIKNNKNILIEDRYVSDEEFLAILKISDLVILPYRVISQSGVLLTAINENVPVLVSDAGGLAEPLDFGKIGWKFTNNDFQAFFNILDYLLENPDEIFHIKNNKIIWEKVKKNYNWEIIQEKTFSLYKSIINA